MPLPTFNPIVRPSPGTNYSRTVNLLKAEFGDGYSQNTPKGLNHIRKKVKLKWDALTLEQRNQIEEFFASMQGYLPFYYKPYGEDRTLKWTCEEWSSDIDGGVFTFSAELVQSFTNEV